jgi:HPt (histidine-containing phosphotransfer) domain-containing protein
VCRQEQAYAEVFKREMTKPIESQELFKVVRDLGTPEANTRLHRPQTTQMDTVIDRPALLATVEGDIELAKELAQLFLEDYPHRLAELREAISARDATALARSAHTLKGATSNLAAHAASAAALYLEQLARTDDLAQAAAVYTSLENEIERLVPVLTALTKEIIS